MLGQQIHIQSSVSDQSLILSSVQTSNRSFFQSPFQIQGFADNCLQSVRQADENQNCSSSNQMKIKLQKLYETYHQALNELTYLEQKYAAEENVRIQMKNKLKVSLNQINQHYSLQDIESSKNSTAAQDQQIRVHCQGQKIKITIKSHETINMFERKLQELKNRNGTEIKQQIQRIAQLKSEILAADKLICVKDQEKSKKQVKNVHDREVQQKLKEILKKKEQLSRQKQKLESKIQDEKMVIVQLQNNTQYLRSTQNCCQQILNQELNSIKYKISVRRLQYETTKKYMEKIIRCRKYQENLSFRQTQNQIQYLNGYCDDMINKKNQIIPEIKKYRQKRRAITQQIKSNYELIKQIDIKKCTINQTIHQQNILYTQLQDQYCLIIENLDKKSLQMSQNLSSQQKYEVLNQKRQILSQQLKTIVSLVSQAKSEIQNNPKIIPQNIMKDLQKKIKKKKEQWINYENIQQEISLLQGQNKILNEEKDKMQWRTNPVLQKLIQDEKTLTLNQNILKDSIKSLKQQSQNLQQKLSKFEEYIKEKKLQENNLLTNNQKLTKKDKQKRQYDGQKLMQKFRQKRQKQDQKEQNINVIQQLNRSQRDFRKNKSKKGKNNNTNNTKQQKQMGRSKNKGFYTTKQNPLQMLRKQFPINSSEETFSNSSLLESNPALWMLVFFVTVVIPGLCIGYNF